MDQAREEYELGMRCLAKGEDKRAQKHIWKAIQLSPNIAAFHLGLGETYFHQSHPDYPAAISEFRRVIELKPDWSEGYYCLAGAIERNGEAQEAISHYEKAINLAPEDPRPVIAYGVCLTKVERHKAAIRMLRHGIKLNPHYGKASAHLFLADALLADGQVKKACQEWAFVLTLDPMYPEHESAAETAREMLAKYRR